jgi:hypothetical protein
MIDLTQRWHLVGLIVAAAAFPLGCGSASGCLASGGALVTSMYAATAHVDDGRQSFSFRLHEPAGTILLYRISAPRGARIRAFAQLPHVTVPLWIASGPAGPNGPCTNLAARISCTVGEEGCPMPEGTWHFQVEKRAGPAGDVIVWFRIGKPPGQGGA